MSRHWQMFAAYNAWANARIYEAAAKLSDEDYRVDCGAFFKSVHGTLNHCSWPTASGCNALAAWVRHRIGSMPLCSIHRRSRSRRASRTMRGVKSRAPDLIKPKQVWGSEEWRWRGRQRTQIARLRLCIRLVTQLPLSARDSRQSFQILDANSKRKQWPSRADQKKPLKEA